ncbi:MAG: hypothetical protein AVDCRST_MAG01-01-5030 [uncultured Rubrobacteraceae bacterium]|uniref:Uncharacterized protein n=1 Tax=uncultured Rubrobacteraceae bacterium TaxID=349277 RepID=A0A6J4QTM6_9ACTN|nr:MAG: hypothetical protein AVDCRST_MAG01-01-5030 [uncultured Rubrobacteraceae bacterium]
MPESWSIARLLVGPYPVWMERGSAGREGMSRRVPCQGAGAPVATPAFEQPS